MNYKKYKNRDGSEAPGICRVNDDGTESFIPNNSENRDWKAYQKWLSEGNTPDPAED